MSTIGDLPTPKTKSEYLFVIFELLIGLLTFATVLGYIANIVANVSAARKDFQGGKTKCQGCNRFLDDAALAPNEFRISRERKESSGSLCCF